MFFLMIRQPPRSTRTENTRSLHDALPICIGGPRLRDHAALDLDLSLQSLGFQLLVAAHLRGRTAALIEGNVALDASRRLLVDLRSGGAARTTSAHQREIGRAHV